MANISKVTNSKFKDNRFKAFVNIMYTANWLSNKQVLFFKPFDISPQQHNILRILRGAGEPLKVQTVKERMIERAPNVTRLMDKLISKELIARKACKTDRRVVHINITKKGLALLKDIDVVFNSDILEQITQEEAEQLSNLLDKIR
ncbi:MarR family transcriptional regulator [Lacinutrix neustonica]|uniref:MarR family transcriptional regulator n=1 Tax=Lacinutrix neustonica TaxID=2980107 RepID=A0A9E8MYI8_9FLAO|nr:MarR family transcriptional regulator [Lacinutrix neustonica]WAC02610.1 MarR family transcriptional regulator [Lacinutrix neustonica]